MFRFCNINTKSEHLFYFKEKHEIKKKQDFKKLEVKNPNLPERRENHK